MYCRDRPQEGAILGVVRPTEKHRESVLRRITQQNINNGDSGRLQCSIFVVVALPSREKSAPCDAAFRRNYLITCFLFIHVVQTTASRLGNISDRVQGRIYQQGASIATANRLRVSGTGQALYKYCAPNASVKVFSMWTDLEGHSRSSDRIFYIISY